MAGAQRIGWIDQARGLGIAVVVIGHVTSNLRVHDWIFLFHMPFFFALSGMLARPVAIRTGVIARARALLIPYVAYLPLVAILDLGLGYGLGTPSLLRNESLRHYAFSIVFGGEKLVGPFGTFWFVTCLYGASIVFNIAIHHLSSAYTRNIFFALCLVGSYCLPRIASPFGVLAVPLALSFFYAGWLCRDRMPPGPSWTALALVLFVAAGSVSGPFDMKYLRFGLLPANAIAALAGSVALIGIARLTGRVPGVGTVLGVLGRASLVVMFLHQVIHFHLMALLPEWVVFLFSLVLPVGAWWLFGRWRVTRRLLLGTDWPKPGTATG